MEHEKWVFASSATDAAVPGRYSLAGKFHDVVCDKIGNVRIDAVRKREVDIVQVVHIDVFGRGTEAFGYIERHVATSTLWSFRVVIVVET